MKAIHVLLLFVAISFASIAVAQEKSAPDLRLKEVYSEQNLSQMHQASIDYLNFYLDNGWFVVENDVMPKVLHSPYLYYVDEETGMKSDRMVTSIELDNMNIMKFHIETEFDKKTFYRVADTGIILGFHSSKDLANMYNKSKNK